MELGIDQCFEEGRRARVIIIVRIQIIVHTIDHSKIPRYLGNYPGIYMVFWTIFWSRRI